MPIADPKVKHIGAFADGYQDTLNEMTLLITVRLWRRAPPLPPERLQPRLRVQLAAPRRPSACAAHTLATSVSAALA